MSADLVRTSVLKSGMLSGKANMEQPNKKGKVRKDYHLNKSDKLDLRWYYEGLKRYAANPDKGNLYLFPNKDRT
jgi:hypothetical protein